MLWSPANATASVDGGRQSNRNSEQKRWGSATCLWHRAQAKEDRSADCHAISELKCGQR